MNRLDIFQQVYGTDYVFTVKELERLRQVTELIVRECAEVARLNTRVDSKVYLMIQKHFGVEE